MINTYQYFSNRLECTVEIAFKDGIFYKVTINDLTVSDTDGVCNFPLTESWFIKSLTLSKNNTLVKIQEDVTFDIFYNLYAYKQGSKIKAKRAWDNLSKKDQLSAYHYIAAYKQHKKTSGEFLQHASSYLNGKVWE